MSVKWRRAAVVAFVSGVLVGTAGTAAFASTAYSGWIDKGVSNGIDYLAQSWSSSDTKAGGGQIKTASGSAPVGWMGVQAFFYRNYALCTSAQYPVFNSTAVTMLGASVQRDCGSGNYYSNSNFYRWGGSTYDQSSYPQSPMVSW